jgi:hypothetical protein
MGLTGAPAVEAIEAVQPVAIIAGGIDGRLPATETGDMIPRDFIARHTQAAIAGEYSRIAIRPDTGALLWIKSVWLQNGDAAASTIFRVGIATNPSIVAYGGAGWVDTRMPSLVGAGITPTPVSIGRVGGAALPTHTGYIDVPMGARTIYQLRQDWILVLPGLQSLVVTNMTANMECSVAFSGTCYTWPPE